MVGVNNDMESGLKECPLCSVGNLSPTEFEAHKSTPEHRVKWLKHWYQNNKNLLAEDKKGIKITTKGSLDGISVDHRNGQISVYMKEDEQKVFQLGVKNVGTTSVLLRQVEPLHSCPCVTLSDQHGVCRGEKFVRVLSGVGYEIDCKAVGKTMGVEQVPITFQFEEEKSQELFFIVRTIQVNVQDQVAEESGPSSMYHRPTPGPVLYFTEENIIPGIPIKTNKTPGGNVVKKISLKNYNCSRTLQQIAQKNFNASKVTPELRAEAKKIREMMKAGLNPTNHCQWFQTLLWAEEMQMEIDIRNYSMDEAPLKTVPLRHYSYAQCVELMVPGLAENRPSILKGDNVLVNYKGTRRPLFAGVVHEVKENSVYLAFGKEFMDSFVDNMKVSVSFQFNRHPLKVGHRALDMSQDSNLSHLTFPTTPPPPPPPQTPLQNILAYNKKLESNEEQMLAIKNIVSGVSRPAPYVLFGPPGTGKTVTIVEAIKQLIIKLQPKSRVFACTPSNSAADLLAERLLEHIPSTQILRIYAASHHISKIPDKLRSVSNLSGGGNMYYPSLENLQQYRVVLCTMVTAARLVSLGIPDNFFTHVFLDECGHSTEPEALIPLSGIVTPNTQVVLVGDPHQLGPVIRNPQCFSSQNLFERNGLDMSYLERMMNLDMYKPKDGHGFNTQVATKLLNNYRSHKSILKEPNDLFYSSELKVCGDQMLIRSLCTWEHLPKRNFPLVFHGVKGKDEREGSSPSFFNSQEVSATIGWVKKLLDTRSPKIEAKDIGIITPYRRQVQKIRSQLGKVRGTGDLKVGSPEEFQGDERLVIIISTVRASADMMGFDQVYKLGFLRNPKRFNVSITRAKALLIVVGCPEILSLDEHWGSLLRYIQKQGGYKGHSFSSSSQMDDIINNFSNLNLKPVPVLGGEVSVKELAEAPEWRAEH